MEGIKESIVYDWKSISKRALWSLFVPCISIIYPILNDRKVKSIDMETFVDKFIPFNKYFIIPYLSWYFYVGIFLILLCIVDEKNYYRLLISLICGMLISYTIFYIYPTHVTRPVIQDDDIFSNLVLLLYGRDNPINCFPSIHVLNSILVTIYVEKEEKLKKSTKIIASVISLTIILSTMFIKQHFFLDVAGGTLLAYLIYFAIYAYDEYIEQRVRVNEDF